ncbi:MAG: cell division protein ZapE [Gammaproteobacteria bacterium]
MEFDTSQQKVIKAFNRLQQDMLAYQGWRGFFQNTPKGIYCYGPVGRGKTLLMDMFFAQLPGQKKERLHFHAFMQYVHAQMFANPHEKDPLVQIAKAFARKIKILCLDEMMVDDVADAMILARLFTALHAQGVVLVLTSNTAPENLYKNGVQRQNFIPAIKLIQHHTEVISIGEGQDYRIKTLSESGVFFTPLTTENEKHIAKEFDQISNQVFELDKKILIHGREFVTKALAADTVWFTFAELCEKPRAYPDYLTLASQFKTFFITNMPVCAAKDDAAVRRFVHLIDVLYDKKIILILSAAADVLDLYQGKDLKTEFTRTQSRLIEMRTPEYWHRNK